MGRPKKSETGPVPTRERILQRALELFADRGFEAVSVREITRSLGLNEASLYNHFEGKAALLDALLQRLEERLIQPGFKVPPPEFFSGEGAYSENGPVDPVDFLTEGARHFFSRTKEETFLTWRMVMIGQFRYASARRGLENQILNAPLRFFVAILENMRSAGRIRADVDCRSAGRVIAAIFFDFSFRANLKAAWDEESDAEFSALTGELRCFMQEIML